jgi:hypothetical protein
LKLRYRSPEDIIADSDMTRAQKIELLERMAYEVAEREVAQFEGMTRAIPVEPTYQLTPRQALNRLRRGDRVPTNTQHGAV